MRRSVGLILVGIGAFCLALSPLMRFYVAEQVIAAPRNFYVATTLEASEATYFDPALLKLRKGATLQATNTVRADVRAGSDKIAVWDSSTVIKDKDRDKQIDINDFRIALDRRTAQLVNCCGVKVGDDTSVKMSGYGIIFPVGNVEKTDYSFFDMTTKQAWPMRYTAEEKVRGLRTYRFVQDIPTTKTAHLGSLPASVFGIKDKKDKNAQVKADRYFSATITYWVDARTGIPVKQEERIRHIVTSVDGKATMEAGAADLVTIDKDQQNLIELSKGYAAKISAFRVLVPAGALIAGLLLTLIGGALTLIGGGGGGQRDGDRRTGTPSGGAPRSRQPVRDGGTPPAAGRPGGPRGSASGTGAARSGQVPPRAGQGAPRSSSVASPARSVRR